MTKYKKHSNGDGVPISTDSTIKLACCDCGLVHIIQFFGTSQGLDMAHWRDNRATAQLRRYNYGNLQRPGKKYLLKKIKT